MQETENIIPAIKPVVFNAGSSAYDGSEQLMPDLLFKFSIQNQQIILQTDDARRPAAMLIAIEFASADYNFPLCPGIVQEKLLLMQRAPAPEAEGFSLLQVKLEKSARRHRFK
jgi:hypothetical protein